MEQTQWQFDYTQKKTLNLKIPEDQRLNPLHNRILSAMKKSGRPLALHEFAYSEILTNQHCLNTRLDELKRWGYVGSKFRDKKPFKEWFLI